MNDEKLKENKKTAKDMTQGPIVSTLFRFFLPIAAGMLFQQLYNAVDAFVVSKYIGTNALAAVGGSAAIITMVIIGFCTALTSGCSVVIAQLFGAEENEKMKDAVKTSFVFCFMFGIVVSILSIIASRPLLLLLKTPDVTLDDANMYLQIYSIGVFAALIYNMGADILRSVGNARYPLICLSVGCGLNIILDLFFVIVLNMGVVGVASATVISEFATAVMVTIRLLVEKGPHRLSFFGTPMNGKILVKMLKIGLPAGLQNSMYGISSAILQVSINSLGTVVVASWSMSGKIDGVFWSVTAALGTAITVFIGQNYGANNELRIKQGTKKGLIMHWLITITISSSILILGRWLLAVLTNDVEVIETTWKIMLLFVPFYVIWSVIEVISATLRGMGDTLIPSIILVIGVCVVRVIWIYTIFIFVNTLTVLCLTYLVSWIITAIALVIYFLKKKRIYSNKC